MISGFRRVYLFNGIHSYQVIDISCTDFPVQSHRDQGHSQLSSSRYPAIAVPGETHANHNPLPTANYTRVSYRNVLFPRFMSDLSHTFFAANMTRSSALRSNLIAQINSLLIWVFVASVFSTEHHYLPSSKPTFDNKTCEHSENFDLLIQCLLMRAHSVPSSPHQPSHIS